MYQINQIETDKSTKMHDLARVLALLFVTLFNLVVLFVWDPLFKIHAPFGMPPPQPVDPPLCTPQYQDVDTTIKRAPREPPAWPDRTPRRERVG
ncbi:hypothetical protein J6590_055826 [Homalodisca vitripennis]|nr:hypothetical protein J6590_055826 [Homalodisca vitripennis]